MTRYRTIVADPPWDQGQRAGWSWREGLPSGETRDLPYESMTLEQIAALPVASMTQPAAHLYLWTTSRYLFDAKDVAEGWGFQYSATLVWCKQPRGFSVGGVFQNNVEFCLFCRRSGTDRWQDVLAVTSALADAAQARGVTIADLNRAIGRDQVARWWLSRREDLCQCPPAEHWPLVRKMLGVGDDIDRLVQEINADKQEAGPQQISTSRWFEWPRGKHSAKPEAFLDLVETVSPGPYLEMFARRDRLGWDTWGDESLGTAELSA